MSSRFSERPCLKGIRWVLLLLYYIVLYYIRDPPYTHARTHSHTYLYHIYLLHKIKTEGRQAIE